MFATLASAHTGYSGTWRGGSYSQCRAVTTATVKMPEKHPLAVMLIWCMSHTLCSVLVGHVTAVQCVQNAALHSCHPAGSSSLKAGTLRIMLHFLMKRVTFSSGVLVRAFDLGFLLFCSKRRGAEQEKASPQLVPACGTGQALGKTFMEDTFCN